MADSQIGSGHIFALASIVLNMGSFLPGYISPNMQGLNVTHNAETDEIKNQAGVTSSIIGNNDSIEGSFDFIPEGTSRANAKISAGLPTVPAAIIISGAPVIQIGPFDDGLNSPGGTPPWIYRGGGRINGSVTGAWTLTFTLRRYIGILTASLVT